MGFPLNPGKMSEKDQGGITAGMGWLDPMDVSGAGARGAANAQMRAAEKAAAATIEAAKIAAAAVKESQELSIKAQKEATAEAVAAAKEAERKANEAIAAASIVVEQAARAGADFSNAEFERAASSISGFYKDAYEKNTADFERTYNTIRQDYEQAYGDVEKQLSPWVQTGETANKQVNALMGFEGEEAAKNALMRDPSYQFRLKQGQQALERSAIGDAGLLTGNTAIELQNYGQDMASQEFNNAFNRLMTLSTQGQGAAGATAGYRWNLGEKQAANENALTERTTGARSAYAGQQADIAGSLAKVRSENEGRVQDAIGQNALNRSNTAAQGAWNVSNAQAGGAQQNALVAIRGAERVADTGVSNAWQIRNAEAEKALAQAGGEIYTINQRKQNAADFLDFAASLYGAKYGGGGNALQTQSS